jgi:hypothetical protein
MNKLNYPTTTHLHGRDSPPKEEMSVAMWSDPRVPSTYTSRPEIDLPTTPCSLGADGVTKPRRRG